MTTTEQARAGDAMTSECVVCGERTDSTITGSIGDAHGVICDDCQFWCDGNVDED